MQERLKNIVAGEPAKMVPVAELVFDLAPPLLALVQRVGGTDVVGLGGGDLTDLTVFDSSDRLLTKGIVAVAQAGDKRGLVLLGDRRRL